MANLITVFLFFFLPEKKSFPEVLTQSRTKQKSPAPNTTPYSQQPSLGTAGAGNCWGVRQLSLLTDAPCWQHWGSEADGVLPDPQGKVRTLPSTPPVLPGCWLSAIIIAAAPLLTSSSTRNRIGPICSNASVGNVRILFYLVRTQGWTAPLEQQTTLAFSKPQVTVTDRL